MIRIAVVTKHACGDIRLTVAQREDIAHPTFVVRLRATANNGTRFEKLRTKRIEVKAAMADVWDRTDLTSEAYRNAIARAALAFANDEHWDMGGADLDDQGYRVEMLADRGSNPDR